MLLFDIKMTINARHFSSLPIGEDVKMARSDADADGEADHAANMDDQSSMVGPGC